MLKDTAYELINQPEGLKINNYLTYLVRSCLQLIMIIIICLIECLMVVHNLVYQLILRKCCVLLINLSCSDVKHFDLHFRLSEMCYINTFD